MKLILISDTHMKHEKLILKECDVLIHAGDFSRKGSREEMEIFLKWFSAQNSKYKILTAGNHDFFSERFPDKAKEMGKSFGISLLLDEGITIDGKNFWASPVSPTFRNMAFNRDRGEKIKFHWDMIPQHTDVLITHSPPYGIGDKTILGFRAGCSDLLDKVKRLEPALHIFGHIHEAYGKYENSNLPKTRFINAASKAFLGHGIHPPIEAFL